MKNVSLILSSNTVTTCLRIHIAHTILMDNWCSTSSSSGLNFTSFPDVSSHPNKRCKEVQLQDISNSNVLYLLNFHKTFDEDLATISKPAE